MIADLDMFLQRILQRALNQSPELGSVLIEKDPSDTEAYFIELLGDKLASLFEQEEKTIEEETIEEQPMTRQITDEFVAHYEALIERNAELASALGACECWGDDSDCEECFGRGKPRWVPRNKELFNYFVRPQQRRKKNSTIVEVEKQQVPIKQPPSNGSAIYKWNT